MKKAVMEWHSMYAGLCLTFAGIIQLRSGPQVTQLHAAQQLCLGARDTNLCEERSHRYCFAFLSRFDVNACHILSFTYYFSEAECYC